MAKWSNHVAINGPRNGTTTHTINPSTGTVFTGASFTPTAGSLLVCLADGAVTSSTPSGWTLPTGGSAINACGFYVWYRTAAGGDTFTTTHNASNYPVGFDIYEFPAGSTFKSSVSATAVSAAGGAGPTLSGLTGTNLLCAAASQSTAGSVRTCTWSAGIEAADYGAAWATTDGYSYSLAYLEDSALASWSSAATFSATTDSVERLVFAVGVAAGGAPAIPPMLIMQPRRPY
jgi:hypothetical protein